MKTMLRWVPVALAAAVVLGCQVDRLLRGAGSGNGPPADTVAARVAFSTQPKNATVDQTITPPVTVVVTDSSGNPVPSYSGSVTIALGANATGATLSGANTATAANGVATFPGLSLDKAGSGYTLIAASSGLSGATSAPFDVSARPAPPATHVAFIAQPSSTRAGDPISPAIQVAAEDSTGAVVPTYTGAITVAIGTNPSAGTLSGTRVVAAASGIASFTSLSIDKAGSGYTLTASASGLTGATSATFEITALPPPPPMATSLQFTTQPQSAQTGGSLGTFTVAAVDSTGAVVTAFNGTVTLAIGTNPGGGTLSGTASVALGNGVATFSGLSIDKAGNGYTLTASTSGLKSAASSPFNVTTPPPTTGSLTVTTATTGSNLPTSGYTISLDGGSGQAIGTNGSLTLNNLTAGSHTVTISGVASNCTVGGGTSQTVTVPAGGSTSASFAVTCAAPPPTTGSLTVSTATTGSNPPSGGYTATVDGSNSQSVGINASVTFTGLSAGSHTVVLSGVASNCSVSGGASQVATVPAGGSVTASFAVSCAATPPTTGSLTVSATTTGSDLDPDGYSVSVDGGSAQAISDNGSVTFNNLASGSHTAAITGLASNCSASSTSQSVTVPAGGSTSASFAITCLAPPPTNHPPVVNAGGNQSAVEAVLYQLNASFTDVDGDGPWTYDVNWGDGTSSSGTLSAQGAIGPSHTYVLPSDYTITVTVTDAHGASGTDSKTLHVTL